MLKTLIIGDKQASFNSNFAWCFIYKQQFHRDPLTVILPAFMRANGENLAEEEYAFAILEAMGATEVADIAWSMARLADGDIPDPMTWVESFGDDFNLIDLLTEVIPMAIQSCVSTKKSTAQTAKAPKKRTPKTQA